jgi:hypothetical protein
VLGLSHIGVQAPVLQKKKKRKKEPVDVVPPYKWMFPPEMDFRSGHSVCEWCICTSTQIHCYSMGLECSPRPMCPRRGPQLGTGAYWRFKWPAACLCGDWRMPGSSCCEVSGFAVCCHHSVLPCQRPKAVWPVNHALKPLKPRAK